MNKAEAIRGNMNASKEETSAFLREMGIKSLRQRAGEMGNCAIGDLPEMPLHDWHPIIRPAFWDWLPTDNQVLNIKGGMEHGETWCYRNGSTFFAYSIYSHDTIARNVYDIRDFRYSEKIHMRNIIIVCMWLAYNNASFIPF
jgi:hypothetical protein